jgi:glycosyltransferase involved in cell wall biosynthesis
MTRKLLSFVIPAYNEEECVDKLYDALASLFSQLAHYDCEAIIVENGSVDSTYEKLLAIHQRDPRIKILKLARNFGTDGGMTAGLHYIKGDAAILMCADLEDPPELVLEFVKKWEEGYHNVYGIVQKRQGSWLRRLNSRLFYWIIGKLTNNLIPRYVADYRLIDKKLYNVLNTMDERTRMLRGMVAWAGFKSTGIAYDRGPRAGGVSKAYTLHVLQLALRGILAFSYIPLRGATILGIVLSIGSFLAITILALKFIFLGVPFPGFGSIICLILLLFGFLFVILGVMSEYIGMIFAEVKARPNYIVEEAVGFAAL